jgi:hypothetical protein
MLSWAVALVALEVGRVVWAINVVSGLECMSANSSAVSFFRERNVHGPKLVEDDSLRRLLSVSDLKSC